MFLPLAAVVLLAPPSAGPRFVAHSTAPTPAVGRLAAVADGFAVTLADPNTAVPAGELVSLRRADRALPAWPREPMLVLAGGDRVTGRVVGGDRRAVRFAPGFARAAEPWAVPLTAVAAVWLVPPPASLPPDPARYPWRPSGKRQDAVLLRNGDVAVGTVEAVGADDGKAVRLLAGRAGPPRVIPLDQVAAVAFDPSLARPRKPKGTVARLVAADGSRVTVTAATADGATVTGRTPDGGAFSLPVGDLIGLDVVGGKAVYLSDLKPAKATTTGYTGVTWPWAADRTVKGDPLRLPGPGGIGWFDKGLGTHPRTELTYDLGGKYRRFEVWGGLDPVTGRRGVADLRVLVDGTERPLPRLRGLSAAGSPVAVSVDVAGAKSLTLVVDFGPAGDVQADVNWADARLVE